MEASKALALLFLPWHTSRLGKRSCLFIVEILSLLTKQTPAATISRGEFGWYTGEVDEYGSPNGEGRMQFKSGMGWSGRWERGWMEDKSRMKKGFASFV